MATTVYLSLTVSYTIFLERNSKSEQTIKVLHGYWIWKNQQRVYIADAELRSNNLTLILSMGKHRYMQMPKLKAEWSLVVNVR